MSYYWFNRKDLTDLYKNQMADIIAVVVKKKLMSIIIKKENIKEIDTEK